MLWADHMREGKIHKKNRIKGTKSSDWKGALTLGFSLLLFGFYITLTMETKAVETGNSVIKEEEVPDRLEEAEGGINPEAEAAEDIDKYSAEEILAEELEMLGKTLSFHRFTEADRNWKERYARYPAEKLLYLLRDELDSASFEAVVQVLMKQTVYEK